jgi:hypothetical protein
MKISFCTTCMDRLFHLEKTYITSIRNTQSYADKEFVLINYNSKDDTEDWVLKNLQDFIDSGIVNYYKTSDPKFWFSAHAKNVAHKLGKGDILVNLDCDNIIVQGYCEYLNNLFDRKDIIVASESADCDGNNGCCGMISSRREHFYNIRGYDESFDIGWGMCDTNYQYRCRMYNNLELVIQDKKYNKCIDHSNEIRTQNCLNKDIKLTRDLSESKLKKIAMEENYIVNNENWGSANLIHNFKNQIKI